MQKSFMLQVEQDKLIEAYVTHWQELEKQGKVQQRQELEKQGIVQQGQKQDTQNSNFSDQAETTGANDHSYRHESKVSQSKSVDKPHNWALVNSVWAGRSVMEA